MRDLQTWGTRSPRRREHPERGSDLLIWILALLAGAALALVR